MQGGRGVPASGADRRLTFTCCSSRLKRFVESWQDCVIVLVLVRAGTPILAASPLREHGPRLNRMDWSPNLHEQPRESDL